MTGPVCEQRSTREQWQMGEKFAAGPVRAAEAGNVRCTLAANGKWLVARVPFYRSLSFAILALSKRGFEGRNWISSRKRKFLWMFMRIYGYNEMVISAFLASSRRNLAAVLEEIIENANELTNDDDLMNALAADADWREPSSHQAKRKQSASNCVIARLSWLNAWVQWNCRVRDSHMIHVFGSGNKFDDRSLWNAVHFVEKLKSNAFQLDRHTSTREIYGTDLRLFFDCLGICAAGRSIRIAIKSDASIKKQKEYGQTEQNKKETQATQIIDEIALVFIPLAKPKNHIHRLRDGTPNAKCRKIIDGIKITRQPTRPLCAHFWPVWFATFIPPVSAHVQSCNEIFTRKSCFVRFFPVLIFRRFHSTTRARAPTRWPFCLLLFVPANWWIWSP